MPLSRHLNQGKLLYFTRKPNAISVSENRHYRWLAFDDIIQSVMRKKHPEQLTLPHHYALLQPLMYIRPSGITEFGLGAGNIARYINSLSLNIEHTVIEQNDEVIRCYLEFFQHGIRANIELTDAQHWIDNHNTATQRHWFIYDIYQHSDVYSTTNNDTLYQLIDNLTHCQMLTINVPFASEFEFAMVLRHLTKELPHHRILAHQVPHYQNKILHALPIQFEKDIEQPNVIPARSRKYWIKYHERFEIELAPILKSSIGKSQGRR